VIVPRETRPRLIEALHMLQTSETAIRQEAR